MTSVGKSYCFCNYDAIRYIYVHSEADNMASLVREGSPGGRSETMWGRICETGRL